MNFPKNICTANVNIEWEDRHIATISLSFKSKTYSFTRSLHIDSYIINLQISILKICKKKQKKKHTKKTRNDWTKLINCFTCEVMSANIIYFHLIGNHLNWNNNCIYSFLWLSFSKPYSMRQKRFEIVYRIKRNTSFYFTPCIFLKNTKHF